MRLPWQLNPENLKKGTLSSLAKNIEMSLLVRALEYFEHLIRATAHDSPRQPTTAYIIVDIFLRVKLPKCSNSLIRRDLSMILGVLNSTDDTLSNGTPWKDVRSQLTYIITFYRLLHDPLREKCRPSLFFRFFSIQPRQFSSLNSKKKNIT